MSKRVQKVWNAVTTVLVILVVILALLLVGVRLVGLRPMCVLSGSMEPTYHTGSLIYFKNLIGRPVFTIPYLGYVSHWVSNPPGMYLAIALALVLIILTFLPDVLRKASEADARDAARRAADKPSDAPDAKNSGENMEK